MSKKPAKKSKPAKKAPKKASRPAKAVKKAAKPAKAVKSVAKAAAPSGNALRDRAVAIFKFAHKTTDRFSTGFADNQMTAMPTPTSNHVLWNLGHLAVSNAWFASMVDGAPVGVEDSWDKMFGMNSKPVADASGYPSIADVRAMYQKTAERLEDAARARSDADLLQPPTGESGGFLSDKLDSIIKAAWHEGWHLGQIAEIRKSLGLPSAMSS